MSLFSSKFVQQVNKYLSVSSCDPVDVQFVEGGYLFLASQKGEALLRKNCDLQRCFLLLATGWGRIIIGQLL